MTCAHVGFHFRIKSLQQSQYSITGTVASEDVIHDQNTLRCRRKNRSNLSLKAVQPGPLFRNPGKVMTLASWSIAAFPATKSWYRCPVSLIVDLFFLQTDIRARRWWERSLFGFCP